MCPRIDANDPSAYADIPAERLVHERASDAIYDAFSRPLLEALLGSSAPAVSASWVLKTGLVCRTIVADAVSRRSTRSRLGN